MNIPTIKEDNDKIYDLKIKYKNAETENEIIKTEDKIRELSIISRNELKDYQETATANFCACGTELPVNARFCVYCGKKVEIEIKREE